MIVKHGFVLFCEFELCYISQRAKTQEITINCKKTINSLHIVSNQNISVFSVHDSSFIQKMAKTLYLHFENIHFPCCTITDKRKTDLGKAVYKNKDLFDLK